MSEIKLKERIDEAVTLIQGKSSIKPEIGIILGTGLGKLADEINIETEIPYPEIPGFAVSTVEFHAGKLLLGTLGNKSVVAMQGRFHFYEGPSPRQHVVNVVRRLPIVYDIFGNTQSDQPAVGGESKVGCWHDSSPRVKGGPTGGGDYPAALAA